MAATPTRDQQYRAVVAMAIAMFVFAPLAYIAVIYFISTSQPTEPKPQSVLLYVLLAVALLQTTIALPFISRVMMQKQQRLRGSNGTNTMPATSMVIIRMALVESVFVYGLLYFFLTYDLVPILYFYAIGSVAVVLTWPSRDRFDEIANVVEGK